MRRSDKPHVPNWYTNQPIKQTLKQIPPSITTTTQIYITFNNKKSKRKYDRRYPEDAQRQTETSSDPGLAHLTYASTYSTITSDGIPITKTLVYLSNVGTAPTTANHLTDYGPVATDHSIFPATSSRGSNSSQISPVPNSTSASPSWQLPVIITGVVLFFLVPFAAAMVLFSCCYRKRRQRRAALTLPSTKPPQTPDGNGQDVSLIGGQSPLRTPIFEKDMLPPTPPLPPQTTTQPTRQVVENPKEKFITINRLPIPIHLPGHRPKDIKIPDRIATSSTKQPRHTLYFPAGYSPSSSRSNHFPIHFEGEEAEISTSPISCKSPFPQFRRSTNSIIISEYARHSPSNSKSSTIVSRTDSAIDPDLFIMRDKNYVDENHGEKKAYRMTLNSPLLPQQQRDVQGENLKTPEEEKRLSRGDLLIGILERRETHGTLDAVMEEIYADH